jgi:hypothetical protein
VRWLGWPLRASVEGPPELEGEAVKAPRQAVIKVKVDRIFSLSNPGAGDKLT